MGRFTSPPAGRVGMVGQEAVGFIGVHEVVVGKPSDGSPDAAPAGELVPPWEQMRIFLVEFVLEPAECAAAPDRAGQSVAGPLARRQRFDVDKIGLVAVEVRVEVWVEFLRGESDLTGRGVDEPEVVVGILVSKRYDQLFKVDFGDVQHDGLLRARAT